MAKKTFNVAQQIDVREKCANIDVLYGPYESLDAAKIAIPINRRVIGRTCAVMEDGAAVEYWFKGGIEDSDLVPKIVENVPKLEYTEEYPEGTILRGNIGTPLAITVKFTAQTYGGCTISVYKDGALVKNIKAQKGIIPVDLGAAFNEGTSVYTITGVDSMTNPALETLEFRAVIGGAHINTDFQDVIDNGINTSSIIRMMYNASVADTGKVVKVYAEITDQSGSLVASHHNQGSGSSPNVLSGQEWEIGVIGTPDKYHMNVYAYTGETPSDTSGDNVTAHEEYDFELMNADSFRMSSTTTEISADTNTAVSIPFRIYSGTKKTLQAHGEVYDENGDLIPEYSLNRLVTSDVRNYWSVGKLRTTGNYTFRMWATTAGGEDSPDGRVYVLITAEISQYVPIYNVVTNGLIGQFLADGMSNNNDADKQGYWRNTVSGSRIYFQLTDLNYNTNGWKHVDETIPDSEPTGEMMLKMTGDSFGRLKQMVGSVPASTDPDYLPMANLNSSASNGFTAEIIYRSRCIGDLDTKVMTGHTGNGTNTAGFSASYDTITVGSDGAQVRLDVAEDEWIHATMVVDKTIHTDVDDVQDYAPRKLMTLYINGSACAATILTDNMQFTNYGPVLLNAAMNTAYQTVDFFGACEIKAVRFYNRPLYASEVENNYIASIYDEEEQSRIAGRNADVLPIIRFIRNGDNETTFEQLNRVTQKSEQKKVFVYSRVLYQPVGEDLVEWPYVKILTQGTSSLLFPVKNYKIELYTDNTYKKKDSTSAFTSLGWKKEKKFTLKCDYMEAAHLNNTPSCTFYNNMIDSLVEEGNIATGWNEDETVYTAANDQRSPSRRDGMFDAVKGFPCLVYYYESEEDYANNNGVYVGSYMFNIDKSGKSLGFDAPAKLGEDGETAVEFTNQRANVALYDSFSNTKPYSAGDRVKYDGAAYKALEDMEAGEWDDSKWELVPTTISNACQSFEGVANGSDTAGCFYSYEDWKTSHWNEYCTMAYSYYLEELPSGSTPLEFAEFVQYYSEDHPDTKYRAGEEKEGFFNDGGYLYKKTPFIETEHKFEDEYAYLASDFEARYDWDDLEEGKEEFWGNSTWGLKRMIDWVSSNSASAGTGNDTFKAQFNQYFNFSYCAIYYLQMIVFGQVDNAGKNSMWDTWDGLHWMPRPYDLDTMAGLNNTGYELVDPDAELNPALSPYRIYNASSGTAAYSENVATDANARYEAYNTRNSKFWMAFAKSFAAEIRTLYGVLRDGDVYNIDTIMEFFKSMTSDVIGEVYYNRDMATKFYKLANIETFIDRMHGNRTQRFKAWMSKRIIFCDSLFGYSSATKSLNNIISLRSDAVTGQETISVSVGIRVYSPQYVRFEVGSGRDAIIEAYCSPGARYIDPITGDTQEGTLFTVPIPGGNKEMSISGAGNIKQFVNLNALKASSLVLNYAERLNNLDLTYSTKLTSLSLARNKYLQSLDCTGATKLGTDAAGAQLDLSNCENLKYVTLDDTKLTSVVFAEGGSLKTISLKNTTITAVNLNSLHFLTSIDVSNCQNIISYSIVNCPKIQTIAANDLPLSSVSITDCIGLENISLQSDNNISAIVITRCPNIESLNFNNSRSASLSTLDLSTLYGLTSLSITGSTVETIKFPKSESSSSSTPWGANFTSFALNSSGIKYIQYGETPSTSVDMSQLTALSSISFNSCAYMQMVTNLQYTGACSSLFANCTSLTSITGRIQCTGSADSIFSSCYVLSDISGLIFDFENCTSLASAFYRCPWVTYSEVKRVLDSCGTALTNINSMCYDKGYGVTYTDAQTQYTNLPQYFFGNCKNVTHMNSAFYASKLKLITGNALVDDNQNNALVSVMYANNAFGSNPLTVINADIVQRMPNLRECAGLFISCSSATGNLSPTFFELSGGAESKIYNINSIFYGCSKYNINMNNMGSLLAPLENLTQAHLAFAGCSKCVGTVPEGFFANNTKIQNISGFFMNTGISGLPVSGSLFRASGDTTSTINSLTDISSLFHGCSYITTTPNANLFGGASKVTAAGEKTQQNSAGSNIALYGMFYNCTRITTFSKDLFLTIPLVQNISGFFYGCTGLVSQAGGGFDGSILNTLTALTNTYQMFRGCMSLSISSVPQLFTASKGRLVNAEQMFYGCTGVSDFDDDLFTDCTRLTNVAYCFYGCTSLSKPMSESAIFDGCTALQTTAYMFYNCQSLYGGIPATLFESCRNSLVSVNSMFENCTGLDGTIGVGNEDIIQPSGTGFQRGLLAECYNLKNCSRMFYSCNHMTGALPWDIFWTRNEEYLYTQLTDISYMFYYCSCHTPTTVDDVAYMFHPDMFKRLIALTTMAGLFAKPSNAISNWSTAYPVRADSFDGQYFLTSIQEMFHRCAGLGGAVANNWFINSVSNLSNALGAFAHTKITSVGAQFLRAGSSVANNKLAYASRMFYNCTLITSDLPKMDNPQLYRKIDYSNGNNGFYGYCYNDTSASDYQSYWYTKYGNQTWNQNMSY